MASEQFLAFDLGAQSGRAILGTFTDKGLKLSEIHRFVNQPVKVLGHLYWDILQLFSEMKQGLSACVSKHKVNLKGIGIDTWGVDFGFVGRNGTLLGNPYAYWDNRTDGMMDNAFKMMPQKDIYICTGIQFMQFNSIFQLLSMVEEESPILDVAERLLFMPDLFNFLMTGEKVSEYTIATTSQLYNSTTYDWAAEVFRQLNLPISIMPEVIQPGTMIGNLLPEIQQEIGLDYSVPIFAPACHDTGSAVAAVPAVSDDWAYLSSGTWSLMGIETKTPIITQESLQNNFTNEGGVNNTIRFLRNVMGLRLVQGCRQVWKKQGQKLDYDTLTSLASESEPFVTLLDPDDPEFFSTTDMVTAIQAFAQKTGQRAPTDKGQMIRSILESLALRYRQVFDMLNLMRGKPIQTLHIVGGGVRNRLLCQFTANALGIPVVAGPVEATAIGNIIMQAVAKGVLDTIDQARELVGKSFEMNHYAPRDRDQWDEAFGRYCKLFNS